MNRFRENYVEAGRGINLNIVRRALDQLDALSECLEAGIVDAENVPELKNFILSQGAHLEQYGDNTRASDLQEFTSLVDHFRTNIRDRNSDQFKVLERLIFNQDEAFVVSAPGPYSVEDIAELELTVNSLKTIRGGRVKLSGRLVNTLNYFFSPDEARELLIKIAERLLSQGYSVDGVEAEAEDFLNNIGTVITTAHETGFDPRLLNRILIVVAGRRNDGIGWRHYAQVLTWLVLSAKQQKNSRDWNLVPCRAVCWSKSFSG